FRVGNDQIFGREFALHAVQSFQRFAGPSFANDQPPSLKQIEIEGVRGLATLPQKVVGSVHRIADGPLIKQMQTTCNMRQRGFDGYSANFARREPRTELRLLNVDSDVRL